MIDYIKALLAQRVILLPILVGLATGYINIRGLQLTDAKEKAIHHEIELGFDLLTLITAVSSARYSINTNKISQTALKVNETTEAVNKNADIMDPRTPNTGEVPARVSPINLSITAPTAPIPPQQENI